MTLRYHDENFAEELHRTTDTVEGIDYPHLCEICNKFLSKDDINWCGDSDFILLNEKRYEWLCSRCCSHESFRCS